MNPQPLRVLALIVLALAPVSGCGGNSPATPSTLISVGGTYGTRVTVIAERNGCGNVTVQDFPTTVSHTAGATAIVLLHAGSTYSGTVEPSGKFVTPPANFSFPDALYTIGISGQFSTSGFTATVELTKQQQGTTCTYAVGWVGTKQGAANTIPG